MADKNYGLTTTVNDVDKRPNETSGHNGVGVGGQGFEVSFEAFN